MLVIRILGLQAALVAAQLLGLPDLPIVGDVVGGLLGGGGSTAAPDAATAIPDPAATPAVEEPVVVETPEVLPSAVEVTPSPSPEPSPTPETSPEPQTATPSVVEPPVVVTPTPSPSQPQVDVPAVSVPAVSVPAANPPAQQPAAPNNGGGGNGGVILVPTAPAATPANPGINVFTPTPAGDATPTTVQPVTRLVTSAGATFISVFVPLGAAAALQGTTAVTNADGTLAFPTAAPDAGTASDIAPAIPDTQQPANGASPAAGSSEDKQAAEESGGMPMGTRIAIGVAGGAGGVAVIALVMYLFWKRRMRTGWRRRLEDDEQGRKAVGEMQKVEWIETDHNVTFDFGFEKEKARIVSGGSGASAGGGSSGSSVVEMEVQTGHRVELEGDSPTSLRGRSAAFPTKP